MEKMYINFNDDDVMVYKVYAKNGDPYAYADAKNTVKLTADELHHAFLYGMVIVDATAGVEYLPISCKVAGKVATVTYATTDTVATTAKLATVKSE